MYLHFIVFNKADHEYFSSWLDFIRRAFDLSPILLGWNFVFFLIVRAIRFVELLEKEAFTHEMQASSSEVRHDEGNE